MNSNANCSINNIYRLEGRVPLGKAIPFGLQHILAMFVSNLAPITIIAGAAQPALSQAQTAILLQNAMFVAGIATLIQLYPIWRIGSKLPVVMGVSFTFVTVLSTIAANYGYPAVVGAVLVGGLFEGTLGLLAKYWRKIITPIVAASVVTAIGFFPLYGGHAVLRRRIRGGFRLRPEPDPGHGHTAHLSAVEYLCERVFKAALRAGRTDRGLCAGHCHGEGGFKPDHVRRRDRLSKASALYAGVPRRSDYLGLYHFPGVRG